MKNKRWKYGQNHGKLSLGVRCLFNNNGHLILLTHSQIPSNFWETKGHVDETVYSSSTCIGCSQSANWLEKQDSASPAFSPVSDPFSAENICHHKLYFMSQTRKLRKNDTEKQSGDFKQCIIIFSLQRSIWRVMETKISRIYIPGKKSDSTNPNQKFPTFKSLT